VIVVDASVLDELVAGGPDGPAIGGVLVGEDSFAPHAIGVAVVAPGPRCRCVVV